jgi:hypothetical protein
MSGVSPPDALAAGWDRLVDSALLGTTRRGMAELQLDHEHVALERAVHAVTTAAATPEHALLHTVALFDLYRRAGTPFRAAAVPTVSKTTQSTDRPVCPAGAVQLLDLLLSGTVAVAGQADELLADWFTRCASNGWRVPNRSLVDVLTRATNVRPLRGPAAHAVGERGAFLAVHHPDWAWVATERNTERVRQELTEVIHADAFAVADTAARPAIATAWRAQDPDAARIAITANWTGENAADRLAILGSLRTGLGASDEALLEAALDDRAKSVRAEAVTLLTALSAHVSTAWSQRMQTRLAAVVTSSGDRKPKVTVDLPEESSFDPSWTRDGIDVTSPAARGIGIRARALRQLVSVTPLHAWEQICALDPATILEAIRRAGVESVAEILQPLEDAVVAQHNTRWAAAMLEVEGSARLLDLVDPTEADRYLLRVIETKANSEVAVYNVLVFVQRPLAPRVASALVVRLERDIESVYIMQDVTRLGQWLNAISADELERVMRRFPEDDRRRNTLRHLHAARTLRAEIAKELP